MDDGRLPFRREGQRQLTKIADVTRLKALEDAEMKALPALSDMDDVDYQPKPNSELYQFSTSN
jgi:hypothetical protein